MLIIYISVLLDENLTFKSYEDFSFGKKTFRPKVYVYTVSGRQIGCLTTFPTQFKEMVLSI